MTEQTKKRAIVIVLDSVGIGEQPDAAEFGDVGSHTLGNIRKVRGRGKLTAAFAAAITSGPTCITLSLTAEIVGNTAPGTSNQVAPASGDHCNLGVMVGVVPVIAETLKWINKALAL